MPDLLTPTVEVNQTNHMGPAPQLYLQVLACEQENADALELLGVLRTQQTAPIPAVELMNKTIAPRSSVSPFNVRLAETSRIRKQTTHDALSTVPYTPGLFDEALKAILQTPAYDLLFAAAHGSRGRPDFLPIATVEYDTCSCRRSGHG